MNRKTIWLFGLITITTLMVLVLGFLHAQEAREINDEILIIRENKKSFEIHLSDIMAFDLTNFEATVRSSGNHSEVVIFSGIVLNDFLRNFQIKLSGSETIIFKSIDGFQSSVSAKEVLQSDNVFLVVKRNHQKTLSRSEGGTGPMEIVIALDAFSQRWNKHLIEIEIIP